MFWIFHQNISGNKLKEPSLTPKEVFDASNINQFDMLALFEMNIDKSKPYVVDALKSAANNFQPSWLSYSSSNLTLDNTFKPGSTILFSNIPITNHYVSQFSDIFGC